jgi:hypothetical protein
MWIHFALSINFSYSCDNCTDKRILGATIQTVCGVDDSNCLIVFLIKMIDFPAPVPSTTFPMELLSIEFKASSWCGLRLINVI